MVRLVLYYKALGEKTIIFRKGNPFNWHNCSGLKVMGLSIPTINIKMVFGKAYGA